MSIYEKLLGIHGFNCESGEREIKALYLEENMPLNVSEVFVDKVIGYIKMRIEGDNNIHWNDINKYLLYLINYYELFLDKVSEAVDEGIIEEEKLKYLIKDLIYRGSTKEEVKLGLVLCGDYLEDYEIDHIVRVFIKSGEYIFYLSDAIKNVENYDEILFEIAKKCTGSIKVFAIMNMSYENDKQMKFLINEGYKDNTYSSLIIDYIINGENVWKILQKDNLNFKDIKNISYIVIQYIRKKDIENLPCLTNLIKLYLPYAIISGADIYSIYAICLLSDVIYKCNLNIISDKKFLLDILKDKLKRCEYIFKKSISLMSLDIAEVIEISQYYKYTLSFDELKPYLKSERECLFIYYYFEKCSILSEKSKCEKYFRESSKFSYIISYIEDLENQNYVQDKYNIMDNIQLALSRGYSVNF